MTGLCTTMATWGVAQVQLCSQAIGQTSMSPLESVSQGTTFAVTTRPLAPLRAIFATSAMLKEQIPLNQELFQNILEMFKY